MSPRTGNGALGLGLGLAAAGAATAAGIAAERVTKSRRKALLTLTPEGLYEHTPDKELVVIASDGVPLHVEVDEPEPAAAHPDHPTIVFSHGYTLSLKAWVLQRRALVQAGYRVVLWDQRSHGQSEKSSREACTIDQLGQDLHSVVSEVVPEGRLVLVGHSMGGMTVMAMAEQFPDLVRERVIAAAFVATSAGGRNMVSLGFGQFLGRVLGRVGPRLLDRLGTRQDWLNNVRHVGRDLEDFVVERYSFASPVSPAAVRYTGDMIFSTPFTVMSDFLPSIDIHDKREALAKFHGIETLVVNGSQDLLTPPDHSEEIVRLIPGAEHVVINEAGHIIMLEHPEVITGLLLSLVERGLRAAETGLHVEDKPRVRRTLTDVAKRRKVARARGRGRHEAH
ncbi:alpha/beta fold hydrolase [Knoellia sp. p5-6-4]|uniref:alpha/beta fold hydrolase n=1 Tax=unclassified Knoellia TaxID=2618719 RepID=UPI0023DAF020|nr:alpha/beta hydrolase [Knoellia sp. p5-6-4]MDF2146699.1 alpha/beta hydrolase [Knoellia sp. p5-6-4]